MRRFVVVVTETGNSITYETPYGISDAIAAYYQEADDEAPLVVAAFLLDNTEGTR